MKVPEMKDEELRRFLVDLLKLIDDREAEHMSRIQANDSVLLLSPNRKTYKVSVDDAGVVTTTLVQG
ncbi:MAG: hypothetical protein ABWZ17_02055 [Candidatus Binatia bacterium]